MAVFVVLAGIIVGSAASASGAKPTGAASGDTSPVDLATPIDMAAGMAHGSAVVHVGDVRVEVLTPSLLRLEYSPSQHFENGPTVNALNRRMPVPPYAVSKSGGWLTVRTTSATLRYKLGSGPFTSRNTSLRLSVGGRTSTVAPTWEWECTFGQVCQAGAATLGGGCRPEPDLSRVPEHRRLRGVLRQAGSQRHLARPRVDAGPGGWCRCGTTTWPARRWHQPRAPSTCMVERTASAGHRRRSHDRGRTLDDLHHHRAAAYRGPTPSRWSAPLRTASIWASTPWPWVPPVRHLPSPRRPGPWEGGSGGSTPTRTTTRRPARPGQSGATCQAGIQPLNTDGLLDTAGWRLLDDTRSAAVDPTDGCNPARHSGDIEDGYLFVYGHDYAGALHTLAQLTGPAPLLPRNIFGVWYSDYTPYSSDDIESTLYPEFVANDVPLNTLSLDTDWKAPNDWNGWEWNSSLFPDPQLVLQLGALPRHRRDAEHPLEHRRQRSQAGRRPNTSPGKHLASSSCTNGNCKVWDWSSIPQAESNFALQQSFQRAGGVLLVARLVLRRLGRLLARA